MLRNSTLHFALHICSSLLWVSSLAIAVGLIATPILGTPHSAQGQRILPPSNTNTECIWSAISCPAYGGANNVLRAVDTLSSSDAWAVGYYTDVGPTYRPMAMHWDGEHWLFSLLPDGQTGHLFGVKVFAANDVWAVGDTGDNRTLVLRWNGVEWTVLPSPSPGFAGALYAMDATSPSDLWAVGEMNSAYPLFLHWSGEGWSETRFDQISGHVYGVSALSPSNAWAVGVTMQGSVMHYDGFTWDVVGGWSGSPLYAVKAISATDIWAVGDDGGGGSLTLHYKGALWRMIPSPDVGPLRAVDALDSDDVWAVGDDGAALHWDGAQWTEEPISGVNGTGVYLYGVSASSSQDAWAVGRYTPEGNSYTRPLTLRYVCSSPTPTVTSVITPIPTSPIATPTFTGTIANTATSTVTSTAIGTANTATGTPSRTATGTTTLTITPTITPCTPASYGFTLDDGSIDSTVRHGSGNTEYAALWLNRYTVEPNQSPLLLDRIDVLWPSPVQARGNLVGRQARLLAYYDVDNDGNPANAELLYQSLHSITVADGITFQVYPLHVGLSGSGDLYLGFEDVWAEHGSNPGVWPAAIDQAATQRRSWVVSNGQRAPDIERLDANSEVHIVDDLGLSGNWMVRAHGIHLCSPSQSTPTQTQLPTLTPLPSCSVPFADVRPSDWFYGYVDYLYCRSVVSGYDTVPPCDIGVPCFRPNDGTTRGQAVKIVMSAFNFPAVGEGAPHFSDVPPEYALYRWIETAKYFGVALGYSDGRFRPNGLITRGQLAKIVVGAAMQSDPANWPLLNPPSPTFDDVLPDSPYYAYVETAFTHGIMSGYVCSSAGEVCRSRYFLPQGVTTRAQVSKTVRLALLP